MNTADPKNVPALPPPEGVTPNFINPSSLKSAFIVTTVICLPLATSAVIVRLFTTLRGSKRVLHIDDCMSLDFYSLQLSQNFLTQMLTD